jgi:hypothetical protein
MKRTWLVLVLIFAFAASGLAQVQKRGQKKSKDEEKAERQMRMMTALARDETARGVISRTFSDVFKIERSQLVAERQALLLNYGDLFLTHELVLCGVQMTHVATELHAHKDVFEIADSSGADWKRIAADAKKMNDRINDGIYKHFLHAEADNQRDVRDRYVASADHVSTDQESTLEEMVKARDDYIFWRNLAAPKNVGMADPNTAAGHSYSATRDAIESSHGNSANPNNH